MIESNIENKKNQREQSEHSEHDSNQEVLNCSQDDTDTGNNLNTKISLLQNPVCPIEIEVIELEKLDIVRPSFMCHVKPFKVYGRQHRPGVYFHGLKSDSKYEEWICSPVEILAISSSLDSDNFGRLLRFINLNGQWHEVAIPVSLLGGSLDELCKILLDRGVLLDLSKKKQLANYLMHTKVKTNILSTSNVGWHKKTFVLPNAVIGNEGVTFQSEYLEHNDFKAHGTLDGWQTTIGRLCQGNVPLMIAVSTALAGPLLRLVNRQGFCIHIVGDSSCGKTTVIEIAASVWGSPAFVRSWRSTNNGLEGMASLRNDTCLILDEIDEVQPKEVGKMAYMIVNGQGKQRANKSGNTRKIKRWSLSALSTGERNLETIMKEAGERANSGQLVRVLSLPAMNEHGVFDDLHGFESGRALADYLKHARSENYGYLGQAFLKKLVKDGRDFSKDFEGYLQVFTSLGTSSLETRAAGTFALVAFAGELAIEYGLLPWESNSANQAAAIAFKQWQYEQGNELTEHQKILKLVRKFILAHGDTRFSNIDDGDLDKVPNRAGWYKYDNVLGSKIFLFTSDALVEAGGYQLKRISKALKEAGWLVESGSDKHLSKRTRIPHSKQNIGLYYVYLGDVPE